MNKKTSFIHKRNPEVSPTLPTRSSNTVGGKFSDFKLPRHQSIVNPTDHWAKQSPTIIFALIYTYLHISNDSTAERVERIVEKRARFSTLSEFRQTSGLSLLLCTHSSIAKTACERFL
jgi:hypothetical protein